MDKRLRAPLFLLAFLLAPVFLLAQNDYDSFGDGVFGDGNFGDGTNFPQEPPAAKEGGEEPETPEEQEPTEKEKFRQKNRTVELSIASTSFAVANNFVAVTDVVKDPVYLLKNIDDIVKSPGLIWNEPIVVNLDHFFNGFKFNFGANIKPFSINFNWKDMWGFGLDIAHVDITGNMSLSGNLVTASEAEEDKFGVGGAVFVDVGIPVFFHYGDFKIKLRPAVYVPLAYTEPKVTYTYKEVANGTRYEINYDVRVYSPISMEGLDQGMDALTQRLADNAWDIPNNNLGYDFRLSVEYPWLDNLDIGVDMANIPFAAAKLNHYVHMNDSLWVDTSKIDILDFLEKDEDGNFKDIDLDDLKGEVFDYPEEFSAEYKYSADGKKIYRPFAMVFYANYRPLETQSLTLIPSFGFSINPLYTQVGAVEGGITVRLDAVNMFITTLGIHYNDRKWINSIDFALNLRAFEFDLGISSQSQNFVRSWQGAGLGVNIGLKFGW
jgi:hypothetical protein